MKMLLGLFLIAHGLIHASYITPKPDDPKYPFAFDKSWFANIVGGIAKPIGICLTLLTIACFAIVGLGVLGVVDIVDSWKTLFTVGAASSTVLLGLFYRPWLTFGFVINAILVYGVYGLEWTFGI